jgi:predicted permease
VGIGAAALTLRLYGMEYLKVGIGPDLPFWIDTDLSPRTVLYALGLTVLGAVIVGVLPALRVTRGISAKLRQGTAGAGLRFSGVWTFVIVAQVAATVLLPAIVMLENSEMSRVQTADIGIPAREYLSVRVDTDEPPVGSESDAERERRIARFGSSLQTLRQRVASEPGVRGVTFVSELPGTSHDGARIALADSAQLPAGKRVSGIAKVDLNYFSVLSAPILSGRAFHSGDLAPGVKSVIVDLRFVDQVLGGANPLGRRMRIGRSDSSWWEIIGVVKELGMSSPVERNLSAGVYIPVAPGADDAPYMMIHASGDLLAMTPRLRRIAEAVDPGMRLNEVARMDTSADSLVWFLRLWQRITMVLTGIAVLLSLAGIYAVLSFIVSKRTREIGVRVALGAAHSQIIQLFIREGMRLASIGVGAGLVLSFAVAKLLSSMFLGLTISDSITFAAGAIVLGAAAMSASFIPARRAARVDPMVALRAE